MNNCVAPELGLGVEESVEVVVAPAAHVGAHRGWQALLAAYHARGFEPWLQYHSMRGEEHAECEWDEAVRTNEQSWVGEWV